jgi:hypothetical protein
MKRLSELGVLVQTVAVAANRHEVAMVDEAIDERSGHHVITEDIAPFLEAFVGREYGGGVLGAARHQLKERAWRRCA